MSAHVPSRSDTRSPMEWALLVALGSVLLVGGLWLCVVFLAPAASRSAVLWSGMAATVLIGGAVGFAVHQTATTNRWRQQAKAAADHAARMDYDLYRLCEET